MADIRVALEHAQRAVAADARGDGSALPHYQLAVKALRIAAPRAKTAKQRDVLCAKLVPGYYEPSMLGMQA